MNRTSNGVAALCSLFFPGLGQMVQGRVGAGLAFLLGCLGGLLLCGVPTLILWPVSVIDAAIHKG